MNKQELNKKLISHFQKELLVLKEAARTTAEAATHEESKPENEYDTRGLEASYLAGAQSKRIIETEEILIILQNINLINFKEDAAIGNSAVIEVEHNGKINFFFMIPKGGGINIDFDGKRIQTITPLSPLGESLQGLKIGQSAVIEKGASIIEYEVISIF